jgi:hypothetical protein
MNIPRNLLTSRCFVVCALATVFNIAFASSGYSQTTILDNFELGEGHFTSDPNTGSGTSVGFFKTAATTAVQVTTDSYAGAGSQRIILDDDPAVAGTTDSWRLRHLSGGGTPANNVSLTNAAGGTSYVGYYLKTTSLFDVGIAIDDGAALEIGTFKPVIADGLWHLYQWQLQDPLEWDAFAGTGQNGQLDTATVTIDSLFFRGGAGIPTGTDFNATFLLDDVAFNPSGPLPAPTASPIPEPTTVLFGAALMGVCALRRRRPAR